MSTSEPTVPRYHTVLELPSQAAARKRNGSKRSPSLNWRALFGGRGTQQTTAATAPAAAVSKPRRPEPPDHLHQDQPGSSAVPQLRRLRPVKSADSLEGAEDSLGPLLLGPGGGGLSRPCGHSRSVSHDSYFEHLADTASQQPEASALDLSEIQLSFELEEREMRMLSEEGGSRQELPATGSSRSQPSSASSASSLGPVEQEVGGGGGGSVQTAVGPVSTVVGGSKRKRSRLEERLQCEVELRFIDSQSPDQVGVAFGPDHRKLFIFMYLKYRCLFRSASRFSLWGFVFLVLLKYSQVHLLTIWK